MSAFALPMKNKTGEIGTKMSKKF